MDYFGVTSTDDVSECLKCQIKSADIEEKAEKHFFSFVATNRYNLALVSALDKFKQERKRAASVLKSYRSNFDRSHGQLLPGAAVVAFVNNNWILARVLAFVKSRKRYKVEDADDSTLNPVIYEISEDEIISLPSKFQSRNNVEEGFIKAQRVLAVYPGTTSFYPGSVSLRYCDNQGNIVGYAVQFDEDEDENGESQLRSVSVYHIVKYDKGN